ncbi:MAG: hypothetical protein V7767_09555 [Leeuwenhoekiella sp.]
MTVSKLIKKGIITVYLPLVSFVVICGFIAHWFAENILNSNKVNFVVMIVVIISVCIGWIWWSYKVVKWKYWAFSQLNTDDSYKLYAKAVGVGLIWPTGSVFNRTEIWTKEDKNKWQNINPQVREIFEVEK